MRAAATVFGLVILASSAVAQGRVARYEAGIAALRVYKWTEARTNFLEAIKQKTGDYSAPTYLPGPLMERRLWRNGAPYSPNFWAAYAGFRAAQEMTVEAERNSLFRLVAQELMTILQRDQRSGATISLATRAYTKLNDNDGLAALKAFLEKKPANAWRVDPDIMAPSDPPTNPGPGPGLGTGPGKGLPPTFPGTTAGPTTPPGTTAPSGVVPYVAKKYALLIGNSASRLPDGDLAFAANDVMKLRTALTTCAGYDPANVELVQNGTAEQIRVTAAALASRIPDGATVFLYFTGVGVNIDGRDFLAGVDTDLPTNVAQMLPKLDLYRVFMAKGARIFAFFQANRAIVDGHYFGSEIPVVGSIAQVQATMPGDLVYSAVQGGVESGNFTIAITSVLNEYRTNLLPIFEFGWQVFNKIRKGGDTGTTGGGSRQTPTLPVLSNLAADAQF
jgi:hypothetical protein